MATRASCGPGSASVGLAHRPGLVCDARRCPPVIGGALVYKDVESHMTDVYASILGPFLRREVDALMTDRRP
jgi:hypothetical protein